MKKEQSVKEVAEKYLKLHNGDRQAAIKWLRQYADYIERHQAKIKAESVETKVTKAGATVTEKDLKGKVTKRTKITRMKTTVEKPKKKP